MDNPKTQAMHDQWQNATGWITGNINALTDDELKKSIIPGRSHGVWILGHLICIEDELSRFLGRGDRLFPENEKLFALGTEPLSPDSYPSPSVLRQQWQEVVAKNDKMFATLRDSEWDEPHCLSTGSSISDLFKTKGDCISAWNLHQMYHNGQLGLLLALAGKNRF